VGQETHEPVIVGFLCHWCAYRAADLAGMARAQMVPNLRPIRVMCSSRVDPELVLKAFQEGADGVLIVGCHLDECHYVDGNLRALRRVVLLQAMLRHAGVAPERLEIAWASASEGSLLAAAVEGMTARLRRLGPLRWPPLPHPPGRPAPAPAIDLTRNGAPG
jgi:F420-non-reducing hydrogenase iron-sulfur subunit